MQSPRIVVESASATPREIASGVGDASPEANTVTSPATVPSRPSSGAADITMSSANMPLSRRVISSCAKAFSASGSGFEFLLKNSILPTVVERSPSWSDIFPDRSAEAICLGTILDSRKATSRSKII